MFNQMFFKSLLSVTIGAAFINTNIAQADVRADMMKAADNKASGEYVRARFLKQVKKPFNLNNGQKKAIIIGDSHAQDLYNAVLESNALSGYQITTRYIPTVCQMYLGNEDISRHREPRHRSICDGSDTLEQAKEQIAQADLVLLTSNWKDWSARLLPQSIRNLNLKSSQKLVVVGRKSYGKLNIRKYLRMPEAKLKGMRNDVDAKQLQINRIMRSSLPADIFIDQQKLVCQNEQTCPIFTDDLRLITFDGGHFTPQGARYVGKLLFDSPQLKGL